MNEKYDKEMWERMTAVEASAKQAHKRLDEIAKLTESVHVIATETRAMREDLNSVRDRVDEIEARPVKRYDFVVDTVIKVILSGTVGFMVSRITGG